MTLNAMLEYKKAAEFSDFLIVDSKWLQLFTTNHLPMQSFFNAHLELCKHLIHNILQGFTEGQKFVRGTDRGLLFCKETNKICKNALFFRNFSIFAFRCMVKWPLI